MFAMREADLVLDAFGSKKLIGLFSDRNPSLDQDRAYAIAGEVHQRRVDRGEKPVGRKIGFTNRSIWSEWGLDAPIWGYMYDSTVQHAATGRAPIGIAHLIQPRIEPEIQLHFARTPPVTRDEAAILGCIDWIAHGFELVQCPFADWSFEVVDAIAAYAVARPARDRPAGRGRRCRGLRGETAQLHHHPRTERRTGRSRRGRAGTRQPAARLRSPGGGPRPRVALSADPSGRSRDDRHADQPLPGDRWRDLEHRTRRHRAPRNVSGSRLVVADRRPSRVDI